MSTFGYSKLYRLPCYTDQVKLRLEYDGCTQIRRCNILTQEAQRILLLAYVGIAEYIFTATHKDAWGCHYQTNPALLNQ